MSGLTSDPAEESVYPAYPKETAATINIMLRFDIASGAIAQLGERYNGIVEVGGSIPPGSTIETDSHLYPP